MSKINRMSLKQVLREIDLVLRENDIMYFCRNIEVIDEFIKTYGKGPNKMKDVKQFFIDNEEYIDKEKFILIIILNYRESLKELDDQIKGMIKKISEGDSAILFNKLKKLQVKSKVQEQNLEKAKNYAKGVESVLTFYYYDEEKERYTIDVRDPREIIDGKKVNNAKALKKFDEIDLKFKGGDPKNEIGMECFLQSIILTDLYRVFPDEQFGNNVRTMILENEILKQKIKTKDELQRLKTLETYEEYSELLDSTKFETLLGDLKGVLREYVQYIDMDKLLLISAYRFYEGLENEYIAPELQINVKTILEAILENIDNKNKQVACDLQVKRNDTYEMEFINYSVKDIKKCISQFTETTYLSSKKIQEYKEKVNSSETKLSEIPFEYIDIIFSQNQLEELSVLSADNLIYVFQRNKWEPSKIIELYEMGNIPLNYINEIKGDMDLAKHITFDRLNEYYKIAIQNPEDTDITERYIRYLELYKEIFINEKNQEELSTISNLVIEKLLETTEGTEYNETVKKYYKEGILTLEVIAEWSNESFIVELFDEGIISLEDLNNLVRKQKLLQGTLTPIYKQLINNEDMSYNERLALIKSGFVSQKDIFELYKRNYIFEEDLRQLAEDGIVDNEKMQRIVSDRTMEELEKNSAIRLTGLNTLTKKNNEIYSSNSNFYNSDERRATGKLIIDPNEREKFLRLLRAYKANTDLDMESPFYNYEFYVIPDESGGIGLNSVVIAERYYEDKDTQSKFATDNATYFFKYKDLMVLSNLNKSEMTKERKNIVFTASHVIASEKREGSWAKSVLSSLVKTMMSSDLKEYSKKNQQIIIRQKLKQLYNEEELKDILELATEIDLGEYICEIEDVEKTSKKKNNPKKIGSISDDECR